MRLRWALTKKYPKTLKSFQPRDGGKSHPVADGLYLRRAERPTDFCDLGADSAPPIKSIAEERKPVVPTSRRVLLESESAGSHPSQQERGRRHYRHMRYCAGGAGMEADQLVECTHGPTGG